MQKIKILTIIIFCMAILVGCSHIKEYSQGRKVLTAIHSGDLKGMDKADVIDKIGRPAATSKSEVSECWYYAQPKSIWLWFAEDKVDHWEIE